jgi:hypothetical protein
MKSQGIGMFLQQATLEMKMEKLKNTVIDLTDYTYTFVFTCKKRSIS